jgi:uncharacterized protein YndB with AHSA1/START domain
MKKFLAYTFLGLIVILGVLAIVIAMQPGDFRVERKITIDAPAADVFVHVNDFHKWESWSPWIKLDPNAKNTFEGPPSGEGSIQKWSGNSEVGEGSMTLVKSKPNEHIKIRLDFTKPMQDTSDVEFHFKEEGSKTVVTWSMYGKQNFIGKALCLFVFDMDKMIGEKFDEGLKSMKAKVETK